MGDKGIAIVTGAGRGIGREIGITLSGKGMSVALVSRTATQLKETADLISQSGGKALAIPADVTDEGAVGSMVRRVESELGPVEILVNTPIVTKLISEHSIAEIKQAIQNGEEGMQTFNQALVKLARDGMVTVEEALTYADDQAAFLRNVKGVYSDGDRRSLIR